jgi:poly-gamma-glutamate capsule biosynthesis protein CapA/YwtB (metallophosphatase superfamily)
MGASRSVTSLRAECASERQAVERARAKAFGACHSAAAAGADVFVAAHAHALPPL